MIRKGKIWKLWKIYIIVRKIKGLRKGNKNILLWNYKINILRTLLNLLVKMTLKTLYILWNLFILLGKNNLKKYILLRTLLISLRKKIIYIKEFIYIIYLYVTLYPS